MLDVALIGGGVCGLALAHGLQARRMDWQLFEARPRLGGRVLSAQAGNGLSLDLGPTWYWPAHQPSITRLVADLGLPSLAQTDDGRVLHLADPNAPPQTVAVEVADGGLLPREDGAAQPGSLHGGARRLAGGMAALVQALARPLPPQRLHCGLALQALSDQGSHVDLLLQPLDAAGQPAGPPQRLQARRVVLALPPRLVEAGVRCQPPLPAATREALRATRTWMASAAKAAFAYERPFWQDEGRSGNAWVTHPQAVLAEVFDASVPGQGGALAGFAALGAQARQDFRGGMELLLRSQVGQLFGRAAEDGELHQQDWATEPFTCSPLDRADDGQSADHAQAASLLQQPHWEGRLLFGGSETARQGAGYLEGALGAAARLKRTLLAQQSVGLGSTA